MSTAGFLIRSALRNKRRFILSVLSVAVSLFLMTTLLVVLRELTTPPTDPDSSLRVAVRNKVSLASPLPQRQRPWIERIPGVEVCTPFVWYGGKFKDDEQLAFGTIAIEPDKLPRLLPEMKSVRAEWVEFEKDRTTCIVGRDTMNGERFKQLGLKTGDRFTLTSGLYPCSIELRIVGTYWGTLDDRNIWFHHRYLDEALGNWGQTGMWWLKLDSADSMEVVATAIEAAFANSSAEVRAESERAFQMSFVSMWGGIKFLIGGICTFVLLTLMMVTMSTMSMAIRERFRELAVLKALGFQRRELFGFILAESFGLAALGAILGAGGAWLVYRIVDMKKASGGIFVSFEVTPQMLGFAALAAVALGIISCIVPAISMCRMSVVQGLRTLD